MKSSLINRDVFIKHINNNFFHRVKTINFGGELFVRAAVGFANWAKISPAIVGATFVAFGTSSPELSVSINDAIAGNPEIALGNAIGSNVMNVSLILAIALLFSGIQSSRDNIKRDFSVAILTPVITGILFLDGVLSRIDGLLMLVMFLIWITATIIEIQKKRDTIQEIRSWFANAIMNLKNIFQQPTPKSEVFPEHRIWLIAIFFIVGIIALVAAGDLIVSGAKGIAISFGIDEFIIGTTIVALGTSVPELATTIIAKIRGHDEIGLGTILGSNIFNGIFIVALAAMIHPIIVNWQELLITLLFGITSLIFIFPDRRGFIARYRGIALLILYSAYLAIIIQV